MKTTTERQPRGGWLHRTSARLWHQCLAHYYWSRFIKTCSERDLAKWSRHSSEVYILANDQGQESPTKTN